ncbi:Uncharacterized alpha/beta hydrolase domain [Rhodopseudomonas pseudopalustris]|uniref:Uncharacterized alpha/beta hydrolase domain n=1 Tax=Rhodopseudomonas pseudopalustris TaxID=1513892 RepID=A0A1H8X204_9BRAD|nr:Uncharacterized alpha/beta hydrolase domain [Rhodopseudomonas pseudopalustris]
MSKNIVIYSDGTGQDGGARPEQRISNIYKMYRVSRNHADTAVDPAKQVVFYDAGLGTDIGATAFIAPLRFVQKMLGSVAGDGIKRNIADCYEFILNHYEEGDRIFLFGFSRGAYTVRSVANLLMLCGIPTTTPAGPLLRFRKAVKDVAWEAVDTVLEHGAGHPREQFEAERLELARRFQLKYGSGDEANSNAAAYFIGVFDTVAALGASGPRRRMIQLGLTLGVAVAAFIASLVPAAVVGVVTAIVSGAGLLWGFIVPAWFVTHLAMLGAVLWFLNKQRTTNRKTIYDFPTRETRLVRTLRNGRERTSTASSASTFGLRDRRMRSMKRVRTSPGSAGAAPNRGRTLPRLVLIALSSFGLRATTPTSAGLIRNRNRGSRISRSPGCANKRFPSPTASSPARSTSTASKCRTPGILAPR